MIEGLHRAFEMILGDRMRSWNVSPSPRSPLSDPLISRRHESLLVSGSLGLGLSGSASLVKVR